MPPCGGGPSGLAPETSARDGVSAVPRGEAILIWRPSGRIRDRGRRGSALSVRAQLGACYDGHQVVTICIHAVNGWFGTSAFLVLVGGQGGVHVTSYAIPCCICIFSLHASWTKGHRQTSRHVYSEYMLFLLAGRGPSMPLWDQPRLGIAGMHSLACSAPQTSVPSEAREGVVASQHLLSRVDQPALPRSPRDLPLVSACPV